MALTRSLNILLHSILTWILFGALHRILHRILTRLLGGILNRILHRILHLVLNRILRRPPDWQPPGPARPRSRQPEGLPQGVVGPRGWVRPTETPHHVVFEQRVVACAPYT